MTATYAHQLTIVENEEAIDFEVNKRPQGAKKGGKARAEQLKEDNRERDKKIFQDYLEAKASHIRKGSMRSAARTIGECELGNRMSDHVQSPIRTSRYRW